MSAVEELRQAAKRLREAAAAATPGPWEHVSTLPDGIRPRWILGPPVDPNDPYSAADVLAVTGVMADALADVAEPDEIISDGDMDWIALVNPALAEPLAAWLDDTADHYEWLIDHGARAETALEQVSHGLAVARHINRGDL